VTVLERYIAVMHDTTRDRLIYWANIWVSQIIPVSAKMADFIGRSRCWQNAVTFLTHPDKLRKKAQRTKSR